MNVGNPDEHTIKEFATIIKDLTNSQSKVVNLPPTEDDPQRRRPDISRAKKEFDWEPKMGLTEGKVRFFLTDIISAKSSEKLGPDIDKRFFAMYSWWSLVSRKNSDFFRK